jgi:hypothetical protein
VRVAEDAAAQQLEVLRELRLGVEAGAGVVEVDVAAGVEAREVGAAELVEVDGDVGRDCRGSSFWLLRWTRTRASIGCAVCASSARSFVAEEVFFLWQLEP